MTYEIALHQAMAALQQAAAFSHHVVIARNNSTPNITTTASLPLTVLLGQHQGNGENEEETRNWAALALSVLIAATVAGNVMVCVAVCGEQRLHNMTNYFLMSLAIADLMVALLVMPMALVVTLYGRWRF